MKPNKRLRAAILEAINNQIAANDPPETKITFERLISLGHSDFVAKQYIGQCVVVEIFDIMKHGKEFDRERYIKNLKQLPKPPFDDVDI